MSRPEDEHEALLREVATLRRRNEELMRRRTSFEHKVFTAAIVVVGLAVIGAIAYNIYVQPTQDLFAHLPGCTLESIHTCGAWVWDYSEHLRSRPH
jgi:hypothetical protein